MKILSGAVAAAALFLVAGAGVANAAPYVPKTYEIKDATRIDGSLVPDSTYTSSSLKDKGDGPYTDYFTFKLDNSYDAGISAAFVEAKNSVKSSIDSAILSLYSGMVGSGTLITTSGSFVPSMGVPTLTADALTSGAYYIEANVTPTKGYGANYSVNVTLGDISAAPEPGAWALMIMGVGLAGVAFRRGRRYRTGDLLA